MTPTSANRPPFLVVSASGRALARSAAARGIPVVVLDLFDDVDTRRYALASRACAGRHLRFDAARLVRAADELCPPERCAGFVYGSGLEGRPRLIERLARGRPLYGNAAQTVALVKDAARFFPLLDALGIAHPPIRLAPPSDPAGWLVKRAGGGGGTHVRRATRRHRARPDRYFQRFQPGRVMSCLFLADGRRARVVGFNEQWVAQGGAPFGYGGAVGNVPLEARLRSRIARDIERLVAASGLRGLNGLDFVLDGETPYVLELNPRPTATLDLYDEDVEGGLFAAQLRACAGGLSRVRAPGVSRAHAIVYARAPLRVRARTAWPAWCTDLPRDNSLIPAGAPVCSVHASAENPARARALVFARKERIEVAFWEKAA